MGGSFGECRAESTRLGRLWKMEGRGKPGLVGVGVMDSGWGWNGSGRGKNWSLGELPSSGDFGGALFSFCDSENTQLTCVHTSI